MNQSENPFAQPTTGFSDSFFEMAKKFDEEAKKRHEKFVDQMKAPLGWIELYGAELIAWLLAFQVLRVAGWMAPFLHQTYCAAYEHFKNVAEHCKFKRMTPDEQQRYLEDRRPLPWFAIGAVGLIGASVFGLLGGRTLRGGRARKLCL